jgi:methionyl aminopeptidase
MRLKTARAIARMRDAGRMVAECFALLEENIKPGVNIRVLDQLVEEYIEKQGAAPLYKGYQGQRPGAPAVPRGHLRFGESRDLPWFAQ